MCVMSMIMDHYYDKWTYPPTAPPTRWYPNTYPDTFRSPPAVPTKEEIEEFRKLLERARQYDKDHNEPDCELAEKRQRLLDLAEELGVEIDFV